METGQGPLRVFLYGSCVSRDTLQSAPPDTFSISTYVARQSLISAFGQRNMNPEAQDHPPSAFQRRMLIWDANSALPRLLTTTRERFDVLLWDLVDERLGVIEDPTGGITTRTVERIALNGPTGSQGGRLIPFGTPEHFALFSAAVTRMATLLESQGLVGRTILVAPDWAELSTDGDAAPSSFGVSPAQANAAFAPYLDLVAATVSCRTIGRALTPLSDPEHQWGFAPFHYDAKTYASLLTEILAAANHE